MLKNRIRLIALIIISIVFQSCGFISHTPNDVEPTHLFENETDFEIVWNIDEINAYTMIGVEDKIILHGWENGDVNTHQLIVLDSRSGETIWKIKMINTGEIFVEDDSVYVGTYGLGQIIAFDLDTGDRQWSKILPTHSVTNMFISQDKLYIQTSVFDTFVLSKQGDILDHFKEMDKLYGVNDSMYIKEFISGIQAVDISTSENLWKAEIDGSYSHPILYDGSIYTSTLYNRGSVYSLNQITGEFQWIVSGDVKGKLYITQNYIYYLSKDSELVVVSRISGKEISRRKFSPIFNNDNQSGEYLITGDSLNDLLVISFGDNNQMIGVKILNP